MPDHDAPPPDIAAKQSRRGELCQRMLDRTMTPAEDAELAAIDRVLDAYMDRVMPLPALPGDAPPPDDWRPIETAPRDGSEILVWAPGRDGLPPMFAVTAWHESAGFCVCEVRAPTHWKPLTPPEVTP